MYFEFVKKKEEEPKLRAGDMILDVDGDCFIIVYDNDNSKFRLLCLQSSVVYSITSDTIEKLLEDYDRNFCKITKKISQDKIKLVVQD
jgi:hypothetical protein